jgi:hypothetical protein
MESNKLSLWGRSLLAALAYGLAYAVLRESSLSGISVINWIPVAGLRLVCLMLVPARYWPALIVGEAVPLAYENYRCLELFGLPWVIAASVPPMLYTAPMVYLLQKRWPGLEKTLRNISRRSCSACFLSRWLGHYMMCSITTWPSKWL